MIDPLPLDSPLWSDLDACYSIDTAVAALRTMVETRTLGAAWADLQGELQHQGSVYGATDAAIPHLAALAPQLTRAERVELWTDIGMWVAAGAAGDGVDASGALETFL